VLHAASAQRIATLLEDDLDGQAPAPERGGALAPRGRSELALLLRPAFFAILAATLHAGATTGFLAAPAFVPPTRFEARFQESAMRKTPKSFAVATAAVLSVGVAATAQDAVQWRVEDGGNGHWYATRSCSTGFDAESVALAAEGRLVSITSAAENEFVRQLLVNSGREFAMIGLVQQDNQAAPDAGWTWVDGQSFSYANWTDFDGAYSFVAPEDRPCAGPTIEEDGQCNQGLMYLDGRWDDVERGESCAGFAASSVAVVEWSAD
jgi:hypothetical protein